MQGIFRIIRHEIPEWSDELIIIISQVCVILDSMIVDMRERGDLKSEKYEGEESVDVVREFAEACTGFQDADDTADVTATDSHESNGDESAPEHLLARSGVIMNDERHIAPQAELTRHLWSRRGDSA